MSYYRVIFDLDFPRRWWLDAPLMTSGQEYNPWIFSDGRPIEADEIAEGLVIPVEERGEPMDITFTHFDVPVVLPPIAELFCELAPNDVQLLPAVLETGQDVFILVVTHKEDCFDRKHSKATYYNEESAKAVCKPWVAGQPDMVIQLVIDPKRTNGRDILRIKGYEGPFIISKRIHRELEKREVTGVKFLPVTLDLV